MRTVIETAESVRRGERKATEVLDESLERIAAANERLNAFVHLDEGIARQAAEAVDAAVARGEDPGPLAGVPFGIKDLEDCAGMPTSHGSLLYKGRPPAEADSVHVGRLRAAGAVPLGKTATPEFGSTCMTSTKAWGTTRNPWDESRTPGGSSGGSGAAVAGGLVPFATASDGGGSTRIPASFCGLVGFKPSYGRIPYPEAGASMTTAWGALVTSVADAARHLDVAAGPDDRDRASLPPSGVHYESAIESLDVRGLRVAWSDSLGYAVCDPSTASVAFAAAEALVDAAGLELVEVDFSFTDPFRVWNGVNLIDIWQDLEKGMWPERAEELMGQQRHTYRTTETYPVRGYAGIYKARQRLEAEVAAVFREVDLVLTPTTAMTAFAAEGPVPPVVVDGKEGMPVPFTMPANLCWNPAVSVPAGLDAQGLPVGLQVWGRRHADEVVLRLARIAEQVWPWPRLAPRYA